MTHILMMMMLHQSQSYHKTLVQLHQKHLKCHYPAAVDADAAAAQQAAFPALGAGPVASDELSPHRLDLRVGEVLSVAEHPSADTMWVLSVALDAPPAPPRTVVANLRPAVDRERLLGLRGVFLCNAKPSKWRGVESAALLVCAAKVAPVLAPQAASAGQRVAFEGLAPRLQQLPPDAQLHPKKKLWERLLADMRVNRDGIVEWRGLEMCTDAGLVLCAERKDCPIE